MNSHGHPAPLVGVVMGSNSDWDVMQHACEVLKEFDPDVEKMILAPAMVGG